VSTAPEIEKARRQGRELRALTWSHGDLTGDPDSVPPVPPNLRVWCSVRVGGDTKTRGSRRTIALPERCVDALAGAPSPADRGEVGGGGVVDR
jgi:hypothetical protein